MARIEQSIEIDAPVQAAYNQLTQFESYPRFLDEVREVRQLDDTHLHWHTRAGSLDMEWDAEITQQVPDRCIAWRTTSGPHYEGKIELRPADGGRTRVTLTMECDPGQQVLAQHGDAENAVELRAGHDLARFKTFMEKLSGGGGARISRIGGAGRAAQQPAGPDAQQEGPWLPGMLQAWQSPFRIMRKMTENFDQLFDRLAARPFGDAAPVPGGWAPPVEWAQRGQQFVVRAELPGVRREDVLLEIRRDRLTIEGERNPEPPREAGEYRRSERSYGHFYRVIALPPGADPDAASASMQDGVLEVTVPLPGNGRQGRRLEIRAPAGP